MSMTWSRVTYHVQIEDGNPEAEVVFVEHPLEFMIYERRAFIETRTSPRVKSTGLKLRFLVDFPY